MRSTYSVAYPWRFPVATGVSEAEDRVTFMLRLAPPSAVGVQTGSLVERCWSEKDFGSTAVRAPQPDR